MKYLFYSLGPDERPNPPEAPDTAYGIRLWRPAGLRLIPRGANGAYFSAYWLMHRLHIFRNRDYAVLLIHAGGRLVHHSVVTPPDPRFPFMAQQDLQIGNVLTEPEHRGRGLATLAICKIVEQMTLPSRTFWYLTAEDNRSSIRAVEKAGFHLAGVGKRQRLFGFSPFARYLLSPSASSEA